MKVNMYRTALGRDGYISIIAEDRKYVCDGRRSFNSPDLIADFCRDQLKIDECAEERLFCFALNCKTKLMGVFEVSRGTATNTLYSVREIMMRLLGLNATSFVLAHNHPSGDCTPSEYDRQTTKELKEAGALLQIPLADHLVIANYGGYYSFMAEGAL